MYSTLSGIVGLALFNGLINSHYHFLFRSLVIVFLAVVFPFSLMGQLSGTVFVDSNGNGHLEANELRVHGAQIKVYSYDSKTTHSPLQVSVRSDQFGNYHIYPNSYPVKLELILEPSPFPLTPGKGFIQLPEKELYPFPGLIFNQSGKHDFALPVNISY